MLYLSIATIVAVILTLIGGALLSLAKLHEVLEPFAYTVLILGAVASGVLAMIWLFKFA